MVTPVPPMPASRMFDRASHRRCRWQVQPGGGLHDAFDRRCRLLPDAALDGDEGRAKTVGAAEVLIAGGGVDPTLGAVGGLQGFHGKAVGLPAAIAAAFAHTVVDQDLLLRFGIKPALPSSAFFGGTGLIEDQHRHAGERAEVFLHELELASIEELDIMRKRAALEAFGPFREHDHPLDPLGPDLGDDLLDRKRTVHRLAAGHGDGVVIEDLVGNPRLGGDGGADREEARMVVGAVPEIGEDVGCFGKGRLAEPGNTLAAHWL